MAIWEVSCSEPGVGVAGPVPVPVPIAFVVIGILCGVVLTLLGQKCLKQSRSNKLELSDTSQQKMKNEHEIGHSRYGEIPNTHSNTDMNMNMNKDSSMNMNMNMNMNVDIAAHDILKAAITLFEKQTRPSMKESSSSSSSSAASNNNNKVVEYLSPDEMLQQLFATDKNISLRLNMNMKIQTHQKVEQITECFRLIQKYSVNTNHPFFFNQLFGAVDPVALAAEMIALSVNTSAYTYETAPVFTMIERDVLDYLGRLVFQLGGDKDNEDKEDGVGGSSDSNSNSDGLMLPGGSLSNLTALHIARHYAKYGMEAKPTHHNQNQTLSRLNNENGSDYDDDIQEEKKEEDNDQSRNILSTTGDLPLLTHPQPELVAFVSAEAHYSFIKAISVIGIESHNLIVVPTLDNGQMDVKELERLMIHMHDVYGEAKVPFFVGVTAGSTVRGSFDDIDAIVSVCRAHEDKLNRHHYPYALNRNRRSDISTSTSTKNHKIWIHVDGAWGGSAIFSARHDIHGLVKGVEQADSFTFNPHKMLGAPQQTTAFVTRHKGLLKAANSSGAKYLFDCRKNGAEYDLGDASYTCGRRTDSIKLWALLKFHGPDGLGRQLEQKVDVLGYLVQKIKEKHNFLLACDPWPFNVNFFFVPEQLRTKMIQSGVDMDSSNPQIGEHLSKELADVSVRLKLVLHQHGEMMIPYQPISNQEADCFRIVLAGYKPFTEGDVDRVLELMEQYGNSL